MLKDASRQSHTKMSVEGIIDRVQSAAAAPPERFDLRQRALGVRPEWKEKTGRRKLVSRPGREKKVRMPVGVLITSGRDKHLGTVERTWATTGSSWPNNKGLHITSARRFKPDK